VLIEPDRIEFGLSVLAKATCLIAHNGINYDLPVLEKLYGFTPDCPVYDTIIMSKMWNADLNGGHSLESWGERFKFPKGEHTDWSKYTDAMGEYCLQDCRVTAKVFDYLQSKVDVNGKPYRLEAAVAKIQAQQEDRGVLFDVKLCEETIDEIRGRMARISGEVDGVLGYLPTSPYTATVKPFLKNGKYNNSATSWFGDSVNLVNGEFTRISWEKVTLDTKAMLIKRLLALGWKPTMHTEKGMPQIAVKGDVCPNLLKQGDFADIGTYFVLKHRLGLLEGLMKVVRKDGTIPSEADTVGAATGRMTHRKIANLPAVRSEYGEAIRKMFIAREGYYFVGSDLAAIEVRILAHYLNDSSFTQAILEGDIHSFNQQMAGLPTRDSAKVFFFSMIYGAGASKVGGIVGGGKKEGQKIIGTYMERLPSLKKLQATLKKQASKGYIVALDGRKIRVRKDMFTGEYQTHKALNLLIQGSAAIYFKTWMLYVVQLCSKRNIEYHHLINYHDEIDGEVRVDQVDEFKKACDDAVKLADKLLGVNCENKCETKWGDSWYASH
jgi:DNA polymerase I-like protein with 3'-5' exonuclease and polymerase domains